MEEREIKRIIEIIDEIFTTLSSSKITPKDIDRFIIELHEYEQEICRNIAANAMFLVGTTKKAENKEYMRPELNQISLYGEGFICLSGEVIVDEFVIEGQEEIEI